MAVTESTNIREKLRVWLWHLEWHFTADLLANRNVGTVKNRHDEGIITNGKDTSVIRLRLNSKEKFFSLFTLVFLPVLLK